MVAELDIEIEQAERELRWIIENPDYIKSIGLDAVRKEMEIRQHLGYMYRLRKYRDSEHGNTKED